jgi:hypothetical protein
MEGKVMKFSKFKLIVLIMVLSLAALLMWIPKAEAVALETSIELPSPEGPTTVISSVTPGAEPLIPEYVFGDLIVNGKELGSNLDY